MLYGKLCVIINFIGGGGGRIFRGGGRPPGCFEPPLGTPATQRRKL